MKTTEEYKEIIDKLKAETLSIQTKAKNEIIDIIQEKGEIVFSEDEDRPTFPAWLDLDCTDVEFERLYINFNSLYTDAFARNYGDHYTQLNVESCIQVDWVEVLDIICYKLQK